MYVQFKNENRIKNVMIMRYKAELYFNQIVSFQGICVYFSWKLFIFN